MKLKAYLTITVRDDLTGKVLSEHRQEVHSYVQQIIDLMYRHMASANYGIKDDTGGTQTNTPSVDDWRSSVIAGYPKAPICVGTDDTAVTISDYQLAAAIANGSGAGELLYQAANYIAPATVGSRRKMLINRTFNNQSGGTITVKEAALFTWGQVPAKHFMLVRDVLDTPEAIAHNTSAVFQYEIYVEV